jgi:hypothetical protein
MDGRFYGYEIGSLRTSTDIGTVCVGIHSSEDVVWRSFEYRRACVSDYGLLLVGRLSSYKENAREAREFIRWTVKTFDRRGW